ncbi:MAG: hypothetical protein KIT17_16535 [Rubrivivax sp.]|nr:hypothetical protein [Rubrivivax sp.]
MNRSRLVIAFLALGTGLAGATAAQAHSGPDVRWSVTIGSPGVPARVVVPPPPVHIVHPVVVAPRPVAYRQPTRWDVDGDGIPNRHDRLYNPRWDVDGDGIPNRYDHRHRGRGHDRDRDGIPDRHDPRPDHPRHGR